MLSVLKYGVFGDITATISAKVFGVTREEATVTFFRVFQQYRFALAIFSIVPYQPVVKPLVAPRAARRPPEQDL